MDIQYTLEYQYNVSYLYLTAVNMAASLLYSAFLFPISFSSETKSHELKHSLELLFSLLHMYYVLQKFVLRIGQWRKMTGDRYCTGLESLGGEAAEV